MAESDDRFLPISALQHFVFCARRAALIHLEGLWAENHFTAEGQVVHQRVHDADHSESRPGVRSVRGLELRSNTHRLVGKADLVEFRDAPPSILPVEYKRGVVKPFSPEFRVQLCAQALCLEEMLQQAIPSGAIYYAKSRKRVPIDFDPPLRRATLDAITQLHELIDSERTPPAVYEKRCRSCSLIDLCLPKASRSPAAASDYLQQAVATPVQLPELPE